MAINKRSIVFWLMAIATGFLVFLLMPTSIAVGDQAAVRVKMPECPTDYESSAEYFLRCMRMLRPGVVAPYERRFYDSIMNKYETFPCRKSFFLMDITYQDEGILPRPFVEALQARYKNNQTLVDIHICFLDFNRCPDETKALRSRYQDELQIRYNHNQTLVDIHMCDFDGMECPDLVNALRKSGYQYDDRLPGRQENF